MRKLLSSITRGCIARSAPVLAIAAAVALGAGCKKESPDATPSPSPTAVKQAPLAEESSESTGDRVLAQAPSDSETGTAERRNDAPRTRPAPQIRPASAGPRPGRTAPTAAAGFEPGEPVLAAPDSFVAAVAPPGVAPEADLAAAGDELAAADTGAGGGLPAAGQAGIVPNSRPASAPRLPPAAVPPDPQAVPTEAPAFDEGADAPPRRVDRMRPHSAPEARGPGALGPADPSFDAPPAGEPAVGEPAPAEADAAGRLPPSDPRARIVLPTQIKPNAELLLRKEDIVEVLALTKALDVHELPGLIADNTYDAIYWGNPGGSIYYAGVQIWKPRSPIEAQRRYTQMVRSYPNAEETTAVGTNAFLGYWNDFYYLVFRMNDNANPSVVALTCNISACTSPDKLVVLASRIFDRLKTKEAVP